MAYVNPYETDAETIGRDPRLSRRQAIRDHREAPARGGVDAGLARSRHGDRPALLPGFKKILEASRSGALTPGDRSRYLANEESGLISIQRAPDGSWIGYRDLRDLTE